MQINEIESAELKKTYRVVVDAAEIERATDEELKSLSKQVKIPGFRPGHVPMKVMKTRYGKNVQGDVIRNVVNEAAARVVKENKLKPALTPDVNVEDFQEGGALTMTLAVELLPEVPEISFGDVKLMRETFEISDDDMKTALDRLAERSKQPSKLGDDAKAKQGHAVTMDFVGKVDGVAFEGGTAEGFTVEIGSGRLIDTFEEQLVGLKPGDEKQVTVTFPENYFNKELAGKPATFDVKIREVAEMVAPELNDEFAKARGFDGAAALKEAVRGSMQKEFDAMVRTRLKKRLFDALEEKCSFPLPESMVKAEFDAIWGRLKQAQEQQGEDVFEGRGEDEVQADYRAIAERRVKLGILLAEIGNRQKLQVTRDELSRAIMQHASQFPGQEQAVFEYYRKNPGRLDELRGPILEEKAVDWILSQAALEDSKVSLKELEESEEDEGEGAPAPKAKKPAKAKSATAKKKAE